MLNVIITQYVLTLGATALFKADKVVLKFRMLPPFELFFTFLKALK